jgi:hypothetical protein
MKRRWLALIVSALGAVVIAPLLFLVMASPTVAPTSTASDAGTPDATPLHASVAPSPPAPTSSVPAAITFADARSPEDASWYRIGGERQQIPAAIQVGTVSGGVTFELGIHQNPSPGPNAIVPQRPVLGVAEGVVVLVEDDGSRSVLWAVVARDGGAHELLESSDVIVDGVLAPDGRVAFFVTADRLTGDLTGAWRLPIAVGAKSDPLEQLVGALPHMRLAAVTRFMTRMLLSADGSTLGLFRCVELECAFRTIRVNDGSLVAEVRLERGGGDPFALTDNSVLLRPIVPDGPYRIGELVDIASGQRTPLPFEGWPFASEVMLDLGDGPMLVARTAGFNVPPETIAQPRWQPVVTVINLADLGVVRELRPPLSSLRIPAGDDYSAGADLPPGWVLVQGSEPGELEMLAWALDLADGSLIPLPAMGRFVVEG